MAAMCVAWQLQETLENSSYFQCKSFDVLPRFKEAFTARCSQALGIHLNLGASFRKAKENVEGNRDSRNIHLYWMREKLTDAVRGFRATAHQIRSFLFRYILSHTKRILEWYVVLRWWRLFPFYPFPRTELLR